MEHGEGGAGRFGGDERCDRGCGGEALVKERDADEGAPEWGEELQG